MNSTRQASQVRTLPAPRGFSWNDWTGKLRQDPKPHLGKVRADFRPRSSGN